MMHWTGLENEQGRGEFFVMDKPDHAVRRVSRGQWEAWINAVGSVGRIVASTDFSADYNSDLVVVTEFVGSPEADREKWDYSDPDNPRVPTVLFHTLLFGSAQPSEVETYDTHADALAGHERWVQRGHSALQYHRERRERKGL